MHAALVKLFVHTYMLPLEMIKKQKHKPTWPLPWRSVQVDCYNKCGRVDVLPFIDMISLQQHSPSSRCEDYLGRCSPGRLGDGQLPPSCTLAVSQGSPRLAAEASTCLVHIGSCTQDHS